jgi:hypothetical protein
MVPYEVLSGMKCWIVVYWEEVGDRKLIRPELEQITLKKVKSIKDIINGA